MTHPIDPLTPEVLTARILWDAALEGNDIRFLDVWERMEAGHQREVETAYENGKSVMGSYDDGFDEGHREGYDEGYEDGRARALAEMKEKKE